MDPWDKFNEGQKEELEKLFNYIEKVRKAQSTLQQKYNWALDLNKKIKKQKKPFEEFLTEFYSLIELYVSYPHILGTSFTLNALFFYETTKRTIQSRLETLDFIKTQAVLPEEPVMIKQVISKEKIRIIGEIIKSGKELVFEMEKDRTLGHKNWWESREIPLFYNHMFRYKQTLATKVFNLPIETRLKELLTYLALKKDVLLNQGSNNKFLKQGLYLVSATAPAAYIVTTEGNREPIGPFLDTIRQELIDQGWLLILRDPFIHPEKAKRFPDAPQFWGWRDVLFFSPLIDIPYGSHETSDFKIMQKIAQMLNGFNTSYKMVFDSKYDHHYANPDRIVKTVESEEI